MAQKQAIDVRIPNTKDPKTRLLAASATERKARGTLARVKKTHKYTHSRERAA